MKSPNKSLQATRDGRSSSAIAEDVISPACLSSGRSALQSMRIVIITFGAALLLLAGCVTQAERNYQEVQNRHFDDDDVRTEMQQRSFKAFPEVFVQMNKAYSSGQRVVKPRLMKTVAPRFPYGKTQAGLQGGVWIAFTVDEAGNVSSVRALRDKEINESSAFVEAAAVAVRLWKFVPATVGGKPFPFILCVPIGFELENGLHL